MGAFHDVQHVFVLVGEGVILIRELSGVSDGGIAADAVTRKAAGTVRDVDPGNTEFLRDGSLRTHGESIVIPGANQAQPDFVHDVGAKYLDVVQSGRPVAEGGDDTASQDRKSTRLNSSHLGIS